MRRLVLSVTKELISSILLFIAFGLLAGCATSTPLMRAAESGDINTLKNLLDKGAEVNEKGHALIDAAYYGHIEAAKILINKGADVNAKDSLGASVLLNAALKGHADIVKLLIDKGAEVNVSNSHGKTALWAAAYSGNGAVVKMLIDSGADLNVAMAGLEDSAAKYPKDSKVKIGIKLLESFAKKQEITSQPTAQALTKEDMEKMIQTAVEKVSKDKKETRTASSISDIGKPFFNTTDKIMGDNDLAVIIGIEGYQGLPKSDYSYDDAKLVGDYAKAMGFKPRNIELLLEERATKSAIEKIIKTWLPNKSKADSKVFVYYSGHGAPEPKTGDAYIVPFDGDPNYLSDTGYPLKSLYASLGKLQVAEVTVVLDACFSGAGGRSVLAKGARPLVMMTEGLVLSQNMAVLSATQGTQISTSSPEKGHGVFTYYFLKALKDGKKNIAEIYEYIKPLVEDEAKQLNVQQSPSISPDVEKLKGRFILRR
ncbi:MAG: ankyrin repeat domain-containing protein [Nitrospirae bacterium]|nr:ankyrin repeat domain-containing protein [Nitrospirota bacterium]